MRTLVYKDDDYDVEIVVRQASYGGGFRRYAILSREQARLKEREEKGDSSDWITQWAALRTLPACVCATAEIRNLDKEKKQLVSEMDLDELLALPEALVIEWEKAIFACNPHWMPTPKEDEPGEAQEPDDSSTSIKESSSGSKTKKQKTSQNGTSTT